MSYWKESQQIVWPILQRGKTKTGRCLSKLIFLKSPVREVSAAYLS